MKILFYIGHPAHYHNVSVVTDLLSKKGHEILLVIRDKDVLLELVKSTPYKKVYLKKRLGDGKMSLILNILKRELIQFFITLKNKPDMMIGTDLVIAHIGHLLKIPSIILNEDDSSEIPLFTKYGGYKYSTWVLSPNCCNNSPYNHKQIGYSGYHELAYLHPKYFLPNRKKIDFLFKKRSRFFILRFSGLGAHHDNGRTGITTELAQRIINLLKPVGSVFITSERELEPQFEEYRIGINPNDMHHALFFADMYIGDSQTMTAEAAVLGTPGIRFNDFVGRLSYLEELEHKYGLTFGIKTNEPHRLFEKIEEVLNTPNSKKMWQKRRKKMLLETIDVAAFFTWFIENYPASIKTLKEKPGFLSEFQIPEVSLKH